MWPSTVCFNNFLPMNFKETVYRFYQELINERVKALQQTLDDLKESGSNETKSTAGDKHETALAMLQIEQENKRKQLNEAFQQKYILERLNVLISSERIINGSLVKTNKGFFFVSAALGKILVDGVGVIALSAQSPLGKKMLGAKVGDAVDINNIEYVIEEVQ